MKLKHLLRSLQSSFRSWYLLCEFHLFLRTNSWFVSWCFINKRNERSEITGNCWVNLWLKWTDSITSMFTLHQRSTFCVLLSFFRGRSTRSLWINWQKRSGWFCTYWRVYTHNCQISELIIPQFWCTLVCLTAVQRNKSTEKIYIWNGCQINVIHRCVTLIHFACHCSA